MDYPKVGIATDAAHSMKNGVTEYQAIDLSTGERLFYQNLGNQTTNIGEFLGLMAAIKYVIENDFQPSLDLQKAEIFLKVMDYDVSTIEVRHWDTDRWGENPADFGNKG